MEDLVDNYYIALMNLKCNQLFSIEMILIENSMIKVDVCKVNIYHRKAFTPIFIIFYYIMCVCDILNILKFRFLSFFYEKFHSEVNSKV